MYPDTILLLRHARRSLTTRPLGALALLLMLAGCGLSSGATGGANPANPANPGGGGGAGARACSGGYGSVSDLGHVALVLSPSSPQATVTPGGGGPAPREGSAHVGDIIQVQLPVTQHWGNPRISGGVSLLAPAGVQDNARNVCFWNFKATAKGDATIDFVGGALCAPNRPCPLYAIPESYLVHVA